MGRELVDRARLERRERRIGSGGRDGRNHEDRTRQERWGGGG
jgi:hypothetical protein